MYRVTRSCHAGTGRLRSWGQSLEEEGLALVHLVSSRIVAMISVRGYTDGNAHMLFFALYSPPTFVYQWCREAFAEKEARLKSFYEGSKTFEETASGVGVEHASRPETIDSHSRRTGRMALLFFVALLILVVGYGGTIFGLYALWSGCMFTLGTAFGGFDTAELYFASATFRVNDSRELKQD